MPTKYGKAGGTGAGGKTLKGWREPLALRELRAKHPDHSLATPPGMTSAPPWPPLEHTPNPALSSPCLHSQPEACFRSPRVEGVPTVTGNVL